MTRPHFRASRAAARGMTLVEILVVLVLIGVVLGIVGGNFLGRGEKAKADAAKIEIGQIGQALETIILGNFRVWYDWLQPFWNQIGG